MPYRSEHEGEFIVTVWHTIFRTGDATPAVLATETGLDFVDTKIGEIGLGHFGRVLLLFVDTIVKRFDSVMQR